jgi:protein disulfide-isomerase
MTLSMPEQVTNTPPATAAAKSTQGQEPKLAMDGFCAVSVVNEARWVEGRPEFGVVHLGKLYLFASDSAMKTFLADPMPYTPVLNEIDVVRFFEERVIVPGKREWAMQDPSNKRMFFFADQEAMQHFENEYARYVDAAIMVMDKAVKESNPGG